MKNGRWILYGKTKERRSEWVKQSCKAQRLDGVMKRWAVERIVMAVTHVRA